MRIKEVVKFLKAHDLSLSTAESCTGGLIASLLAEVPGCGEILDRGYVVYAPQAKYECLGVKVEIVEEYGLSSTVVAQEMAIGALRRSQSVIAVSNTGLAEAEGDMDGRVFFGWAARIGGREHVITEEVQFPGDRNEVRESAARYALDKIAVHMNQFWMES